MATIKQADLPILRIRLPERDKLLIQKAAKKLHMSFNAYAVNVLLPHAENVTGKRKRPAAAGLDESGTLDRLEDRAEA